jgi:acetyl esterase/lipase
MGANRPPSELWPDVLENGIHIPMGDGTSNRARIYSPQNALSGGSPLLVMAYGGGWITGKLEQEETNCRAWTKIFGGVAVSIDYR